MLQRRMPGRLMGSVPLMGGGLSYLQKVQGTQRANQILYHPMNEPSGGVAIDYSPEGNNGAYTGVTLGQPGIGDGLTCPLFDGANDFNDLYSIGFRDDFNGAEGTVHIPIKVSGAGVWTDGVTRYVFRLFRNASNLINIRRTAINNELRVQYIAGGVSKSITISSISDTSWIYLDITWSALADEMKVYLNSIQQGITQTGLGVWAGNLTTAGAVVGASSTVPVQVWDGFLAHYVVWTTPLSQGEITKISNP